MVKLFGTEWQAPNQHIFLGVLTGQTRVTFNHNGWPEMTAPEHWRLTRRRRLSPVFLAEILACWMNSFWCLLYFTSPSRLQTDILSSNSTAAWWGMEGAWERVGARRDWWRKKERKKESLFQHQKTVSETRGNTLTLPCSFWLNISVLWAQYTAATEMYYLFHSS